MKKYIPIRDSVFDHSDDQFVLEGVYRHVSSLLDGPKFLPKTIENRKDIPFSAKIGWHLWLFEIEVASAGIPDYLQNHCETVEQIVYAHRALEIVQANELLVLFEAAIPIVKGAAEDFGIVTDYPRHEWFNQFSENPNWLDREKIARASFKLAEAPLETLAAKYLRAHRAELQLKL